MEVLAWSHESQLVNPADSMSVRVNTKVQVCSSLSLVLALAANGVFMSALSV